MTPRLRHLPRPAPQPPGAAPGGARSTVRVAAPAAAGGGIARVPRFAVVRAATPAPAADNPAAPATAAGGGSHENLRDVLSGLVEELAGKEAPGGKRPARPPTSVAEEPPPVGPLPGRGAPWRRAPSPWAGAAGSLRSGAPALT